MTMSEVEAIKVLVVYEETPGGLVRRGTACFSTTEGKLNIRIENVFNTHFDDPFSPKLVFKEA